MSGSRVDLRGEGEQGNHENTLSFVVRVLGQVLLYVNFGDELKMSAYEASFHICIICI